MQVSGNKPLTHTGLTKRESNTVEEKIHQTIYQWAWHSYNLDKWFMTIILNFKGGKYLMSIKKSLCL